MPVDDFEELLVSVLKSTPAVIARVGSRIYPMVRPQDSALPAITYQKISGNPQVQMSGPHNMFRERFQITCFAARYSQMKQTADAVRGAFNGYDSTVDSVEVHIATIDNEVDLISELPDVRDARVYARAIDFIIWYKVN